jgi:hypothetical protein
VDVHIRGVRGVVVRVERRTRHRQSLEAGLNGLHRTLVKLGDGRKRVTGACGLVEAVRFPFHGDDGGVDPRDIELPSRVNALSPVQLHPLPVGRIDGRDDRHPWSKLTEHGLGDHLLVVDLVSARAFRRGHPELEEDDRALLDEDPVSCISRIVAEVRSPELSSSDDG